MKFAAHMLLVVFLHLAPAFAAPVITEDFDTTDGWGNLGATGGGTPFAVTAGGTLAFGLDVWGGGIDQQFIGSTGADDLITALASANTSYSVTFSFFADAMAGGEGTTASPAGLWLFFGDASAGSYWAYNLFNGGPASAGWNSYAVNLDGAAGWFTTGTPGAFATALTTAPDMGIYITYQDWSGQEFGLDNFTLDNAPLPVGAIPEPHEWALLFAAMLALAIPFRTQIEQRLALLRVRA